MKPLKNIINEKLVINKHSKSKTGINLDGWINTNEKDDGKLPKDQKTFVETMAEAFIDGKFPNEKINDQFDLTYNNLDDCSDYVQISNHDDAAEWIENVSRYLYNLVDAEDEEEKADLDYNGYFEDISSDIIQQFVTMIEYSAKLIIALFNNDLHGGNWTDDRYVEYNTKTGQYKDLDIAYEF